MITVLLDNGHGADTSGKRSPLKEDGTRLYEWLYTRKIVKKLSLELKNRGYNVILITPEDYDVTLSTRVQRINNQVKKYSPANCIMISMHLDAAGSEDKWMGGRGFSVYTTKGQNNSDKLAECIYDAAEEILQKDPILMDTFKDEKIQKPLRTDKSDGDRDKEANFAIINGANCPAVLIENFFLDNKKDVAYLESAHGFNKLIETHIKGIENYSKLKNN